jgi:hypothetical protein
VPDRPDRSDNTGTTGSLVCGLFSQSSRKVGEPTNIVDGSEGERGWAKTGKVFRNYLWLPTKRGELRGWEGNSLTRA